MELIPVGEDRLRDILQLDTWAFPSQYSADESLAWPQPLDLNRSYGIDDPARPGRLVAFHASYGFANTPVPGARADVAGLSWVCVHPEFRRRGLLRTMLAAHFEHCRERGEALSVLFSAEPAIYGRFGYGVAARQVTCKLPRGAQLRPIPTDGLRVTIDELDLAVHGPVMAALAAGVERPGQVARLLPAHQAAFCSNDPSRRGDFESLRIILVERDAGPVGYALFRRKSIWEQGVPSGTVEVREVVAEEPAVAALLWQRLTDFDLTTEIETPALPIDDPLLNLLVDLRTAHPRFTDNLWARLIDVPAALAARQYQSEIDVVLAVSDEQLPSNDGRWRLNTGRRSVERTEAAPDLSLDVRELGSAYLGGLSLAELAGAGLVTEHTPGSLHAASVAFGWHRAPAAGWIF